jgi:ORF6N domain
MFEMTKEEFDLWRSQNVTSKNDRKGLRYAPFFFTEQGVTMLSDPPQEPRVRIGFRRKDEQA